MKKLFTILFLLISSTCYASTINLGEYDNKTYYLNTDSIRLCSTMSCIYIEGTEQPYIGAVISLMPKSFPSSGDVLSYNKSMAFETKSIIFSRDGSRFVLTQTTSYDANGNVIDVKDETTEKIILTSTEFRATTNSQGNLTSTSREGMDVYQRRIAWSSVVPGTPGEKITVAVLDYTDANYSEIIARSKASNYMKAK